MAWDGQAERGNAGGMWTFSPVAGACSSGAPWMTPIELPDVDLWLAGTQADVKHLLKPPVVEEIVATSL